MGLQSDRIKKLGAMEGTQREEGMSVIINGAWGDSLANFRLKLGKEKGLKYMLLTLLEF